MSATLAVTALAISYGDRALVHGLDARIGPGDVVGLVGPNGCGKTTLLRTLAGRHAPDSGRVTWVPADARIGYLVQERCGSGTVADHLALVTGVGPADERMSRHAQGLAAGVPGADTGYSTALEDWLALGGPDLDSRIVATLAEVAPGLSPEHPMTGLSGGQAARVALAGLVLSRFDAYLLDEPTNDLDLHGLEVLEQFLAGLVGPVLLVSHDRELLARTVTRILDFDPALQTVRDYRGGFDAYLAERSRARDRAQSEYDAVSATRADLEAQIRATRATAQRGARVARARYQQGSIDKLQRDAMVDGATSGASSASSLQRQIDRLPDLTEPRREWQLRLQIPTATRSGEVVATLRGAVASRGEFQVGPVDLQVDRGDRILITGPNGSGKTTLLAMILGEVPLDSGERSLGARVEVGRVDQSRVPSDHEQTLLESMRGALPDLPVDEVRALLAKFGLLADRLARPVTTLSPGERTRAALAVLQGGGANLLVMDEPTNHLDLPAIEQVQQALDQFQGTVLLVSHDRRLIAHQHQRFPGLRVIEVRDGRVRASS